MSYIITKTSEIVGIFMFIFSAFLAYNHYFFGLSWAAWVIGLVFYVWFPYYIEQATIKNYKGGKKQKQ